MPSQANHRFGDSVTSRRSSGKGRQPFDLFPAQREARKPRSTLGASHPNPSPPRCINRHTALDLVAMNPHMHAGICPGPHPLAEPKRVSPLVTAPRAATSTRCGGSWVPDNSVIGVHSHRLSMPTSAMGSQCLIRGCRAYFVQTSGRIRIPELPLLLSGTKSSFFSICC